MRLSAGNTPTSAAVAGPPGRPAAAPLRVAPPPEPLLAAGVRPGRAEPTGRVSTGRTAAAGLTLRACRTPLSGVLGRTQPRPGSLGAVPGQGPAGGGGGGAGR